MEGGVEEGGDAYWAPCMQEEKGLGVPFLTSFGDGCFQGGIGPGHPSTPQPTSCSPRPSLPDVRTLIP